MSEGIIEPGTTAPGFKLYSQAGEKLSLADFEGRSLVIAFYPADFSGVCNDQMSVYQKALGGFTERDAAVVGISVDSGFCHRAFAEHLGIEFPLLSDFHPKGEVSSAYGAYIEKRGHSSRSIVIVGPDGKVRWSYVSDPVKVPAAELIFEALDA